MSKLISMTGYSFYHDWRSYSIFDTASVSTGTLEDDGHHKSLASSASLLHRHMDSHHSQVNSADPCGVGSRGGCRGLPVAQVIKVNESERWKFHVLSSLALCQMSWGEVIWRLCLLGYHCMYCRDEPVAQILRPKLLLYPCSASHCVTVCVYREG